MQFAISKVYGDAFASMRRSPAIFFPAAMTFLAPFLVMMVFLLLGEGSGFFDGAAAGSFDPDVLISLMVTVATVMVVSLVCFAWMIQAAAAEVRSGTLTLGDSLRLIGAGTVKVAISYLIVGLIFVGAIAIFAVIIVSVSDSIVGLVLFGIIIVVLASLLMTYFSLVPFACAYEQVGPGEAVSIGTMAVKPAFWSVLIFMLATFFVFFLISLAIELVALAICAAFSGGEIVAMVIDAVVRILWAAFIFLALSHIYAMMKALPAASLETATGDAGFSDSSPVL